MSDDMFEVYGISQNPDTKDYIIILSIENLCKKCGEKYTDVDCKWCKLCNSSGNEKIDDFIQEMQLKINGSYDRIVFEWIPYSQFSNIEEIGKVGFATAYSAIWKDGPLTYSSGKRK